MSKLRQPDEPAACGYAVTHPRGQAVLPIESGWEQLIYAESGAITVSKPTGSWVIPMHRAPWIPDDAAQWTPTTPRASRPDV